MHRGSALCSAAPKVSVFVLTYNHVAWIAQALESALAQEAPFAYEIVVADDCSSDGTREIVREYERRHPELMRTFLPERNLGVAGIWLAAARQCRGEYVAVLEGDDYWTSPQQARQAGGAARRPAAAGPVAFTGRPCSTRTRAVHRDRRRRPSTATYSSSTT